MPIQLNYRGAAGVEDLGAFNARSSITWKGEFLFRIYESNGQLYFIKVGSSKNANQVVAIQFGLLGALIAHFASKRAEEKNQQRLNEFAGIPPEELIGREKVNHIVNLAEVSEPMLNPPSFWSGHSFGSWSFRNAKGKKKVYVFEDAANFQAAARRLPEIFGNALKTNARWDEQKGKVVKVAAVASVA